METRISIKTFHNKFVTYDNSYWKLKNKIRANGIKTNSSIFILTEYEEKEEQRIVSLKTCNNNYISVQPNEDIYCNMGIIGVSEKFILIENGDETYSFKTYNNKYLCAKKNNTQRLVGDSDELGNWERFTIQFNDNDNHDNSNTIKYTTGIGIASGFGAGVLITTGIMAQIIPGLGTACGAAAITSGLSALGGSMLGGISVASGATATGALVGATTMGFVGNKIGKKIESGY